jgi:hypothetical protein
MLSYAKASSRAPKSNVITQVINEVQKGSNVGGFVKLDANNKRWISFQGANSINGSVRDIVSKALRDAIKTSKSITIKGKKKEEKMATKYKGDSNKKGRACFQSLVLKPRVFPLQKQGDGERCAFPKYSKHNNSKAKKQSCRDQNAVMNATDNCPPGPAMPTESSRAPLLRMLQQVHRFSSACRGCLLPVNTLLRS